MEKMDMEPDTEWWKQWVNLEQSFEIWIIKAVEKDEIKNKAQGPNRHIVTHF